MVKTYQWDFPLKRTHTGVLLGNGVYGAMVWGEGNCLNITVDRADYWDHRGGLPWKEGMSYDVIKSYLYEDKHDELHEIFAAIDPKPGEPRNPSVLPIGRFELEFSDAVLSHAKLNLQKSLLTVYFEDKQQSVDISIDMHAPVIAVKHSDSLTLKELRRVTAWNYVKDYLASISFKPPQPLDQDKLYGWVQSRPVDPSMCTAALRNGNEVFISTTYGKDNEKALDHCESLLNKVADKGYDELIKRTQKWFRAYWKSCGKVELENERLQFIYEYGMYKFAGLTAFQDEEELWSPGDKSSAGVAATLQGPWIEEYQMPPWGSDYHFNINVQMCYWPCWHGNKVEHLKPLFRMVQSWQEQLKHNAKIFLGIDDGYMLNHSVSDEGVCIGGFWTGSIDHGCTSWVAAMMYRYYLYTVDKNFLRTTAYPFMKATMRVYEEMMEKDETGKWSLPVSVSPEYRGNAPNAWGRNASFQLACIHRLLEDLIDASAIVGDEPDPLWLEIQDELDKACIDEYNGKKQIMLWEGTGLEESHRHHSHLAAISPFDIFDPETESPEMKEVLANSMDHWVYQGSGLWSGWCVPWAAMLWTRFNDGDASQLLLESWQRVFTNEGQGTLHDANCSGLTLLGRSMSKQITGDNFSEGENKEVMQIEAGLGACAAVQEMLMHTRRGVTYVMPAIPKKWKTAEFSNFLTEGAFLIGAKRDNYELQSISVESPKGGVLRIANPWNKTVSVIRDKATESIQGQVLKINTAKNDKFTIVPEG
ncbi:MAG: hypothetical protein HRT89_07995 [Lentisphaeria bacterium]|nr:hypothetical protein [Lentisphaeria bacterium]